MSIIVHAIVMQHAPLVCRSGPCVLEEEAGWGLERWGAGYYYRQNLKYCLSLGLIPGVAGCTAHSPHAQNTLSTPPSTQKDDTSLLFIF